MKLDGKTVLVIGGAGLIGSHIVELLLETPVGRIIVFDNFSRGTMDNLENAIGDPRCEIFPLGGDILQADILDEAVSQADAVIHLAALWLLHCHEYPQSAFEVNIRGCFNVLEACRRHKIGRLVYSSSASVYGNAAFEPMTEDHPYNNETFYGATKICGEHMFKAYHNRYGLNGVALRYMNVYGPRQDYKGAYIAVMMKMLDSIERNEPPVLFGDGSQAYDFIYVRDVARANICALTSQYPFGFFNIGRGIKTSINELAQLLLKLCGREDLGVVYKADQSSFVKNRIGSPQAAREALGFEWSVDLEEGMRALVDWRKRHRRSLERMRGIPKGGDS